MPWTFAHPAAVLPLRRFWPSLNLAALMLGSLTPDLGYHMDAWAFATYAHTIVGTFLVSLPTGIVFLAVFYLTRRYIWYVLPQPHRTLLAPAVSSAVPLKPVSALFAAASLVLGSWTHIVWDGFTHEDGWAVSRIPALRETVGIIGERHVQAFSLLQHLSTVIGVGVLVVVYFLWVRERAGVVLRFERQDRWRYALLLAVSLGAAVIAAGFAARAARGSLDAFAFYGAVYGVILFIPMLILVSAVCYLAAPKPVRVEG